MVEPCDKKWDLLLTFCLHTSDGPITLIRVYAPTLTSALELKVKDEFYTSLDDVIKKISSNEHFLLLGDFNARVVTLELVKQTATDSTC